MAVVSQFSVKLVVIMMTLTSQSLRRVYDQAWKSRDFWCKQFSTRSVAHSKIDFAKSVDEFRRHGVAILPLRLDENFVSDSKRLCIDAWEDALARGKVIKGHDIKVGQEHGFKEIVLRAQGRYDMQWKIDGNEHFLDKNEVLSKFLPFVHEILGGEKMTNMNFNGCLFSLPGAKEQLWHIDGEHLFTSEAAFSLSGRQEVEFFRNDGHVDSILPAHCLNIFVPLVDMESDNGGTEFCLGSHFHTKFFSDDIVWQNSQWKDRIGFKGDVLTLKVNAGEVLAFDYRVLHRALDHKGREVRPVLYYTFTKRWFSDAMNFASLPSLSLASGRLVSDKVDRWRLQVPAVCKEEPGQRRIFCDGAAGSQTPAIVIQRMADHMTEFGGSNLGGEYQSSQGVTDLVRRARLAGRDLFGPGEETEIMFGYNCSNLMFHLARAMENTPVLGSHDNIVISPACHDANVAPWIYLARHAGATLRWMEMGDRKSVSECDMIDKEKLSDIIDKNTKVICLALASNVTGRLHVDVVEKIHEITGRLGTSPYLVLDGTHYVPHQCCDLPGLQADAVVCSAYKYFGPHLGVMAYNRQRFTPLLPAKVGVRFSEVQAGHQDLLYPGDAPAEDNCQISRWENGTLNYEGLAGFIGCVDYIASLHDGEVGHDRRLSVVKSYADIQDHEAALSRTFLSKLQPLLDSDKVTSPSLNLPHTFSLADAVRQPRCCRTNSDICHEPHQGQHGEARPPGPRTPHPQPQPGRGGLHTRQPLRGRARPQQDGSQGRRHQAESPPLQHHAGGRDGRQHHPRYL